MPVQVRLVEARYRPFVIGLLGVSAICYSIFPLIFQTMLHRFYSDAFAIYRDCLAGYDMLDCVRRGRERNFYLTLVVAPALVLAGLALARLLAARGQKWITFSLSHLVRKDKRKPILFLRSFRDDQVLMPRAKYSLTGTLAEFGRPSLSLDEMLYNKASRHGPVVAIGRPGDTLQPYGAAREYISDETWKMRVADLSRDASTIIACADNTEGTIWELRHVLQAPSAHKTMVLFHPRLYAGNERSILTSKLQTFEEIDGAVRVCLRDLSKDAVGFFSTPERAVIEITSAEWSNLAYNAALDLFLFRQLTSSESV